MKEHQDMIMKRTKNMDLSTLINRPLKAFFDRRIEPSDIAPSDKKDKIVPTTFRLPADIRNYYKLMAGASRTTLQGAVLQVLGSVMEHHTIDQPAQRYASDLSDRSFHNTTSTVNTSALFHEVAVRESWYFTFATPPECGKSFAAKELIADAHVNNWQVAFFDCPEGWISDPSLLLKATCRLDPEMQNLLDHFCRAVARDMPPTEKEQVEILNATRKISELESKNNDNAKSTKLIVVDEVCLLPNSTFLNSFYPVWLTALKQQGIKLLMLNQLKNGDSLMAVEWEHPLIQHIDSEIVTYIKESQNPSWRLLETKVNF
jgi:hypothetical protein